MELRYLVFLALCLLSSDGGVDAKPPPFSFSFEKFDKNGSFGSEIELYGNAEIRNSTVGLFGKGRVMCRKPIRFFGTNPGFSTYFAFSTSEFYGESFAFLLVPSNVSLISRVSPSFLAVKFVAGANGGRVEIDIGGEISVKSSNLSSVSLALNSGQKLHCWIDYDGGSRIVEVRMSKSRALRPSSSLVSCPLDLSNVLWREAMYVGISSSNSTQISSIYSWSFLVKHGASYLMHSEPLNPQSISLISHQDPPFHERRSPHWRSIFMALLFGAACGALATLILFFLLSGVSKQHPVAPAEYPVLPMESGNEKIVLDGGRSRKVVNDSLVPIRSGESKVGKTKAYPLEQCIFQISSM